jgi:hypothetical protein
MLNDCFGVTCEIFEEKVSDEIALTPNRTCSGEKWMANK